MPHSEIRGSKSARLSPRLIAACYVLHRLSVPRHPPNALITLDHFDDASIPPHVGTSLDPKPGPSQTLHATEPSHPREDTISPSLLPPIARRRNRPRTSSRSPRKTSVHTYPQCQTTTSRASPWDRSHAKDRGPNPDRVFLAPVSFRVSATVLMACASAKSLAALG